MQSSAASGGLPSPFDDGAVYDIVLGQIDYGLDFYMDLARSARGRVLDVACGTGRILIPCLQAGVDIEGLDLYQPMLDQLRHKAQALSLSPTLHQCAMCGFSLPSRFALVIIPFNAFIHNLTAHDQINCLTSCREHLLPGGLLAFDTFFPGREFITAPDGERVLECEIPHPQTGLPVRLYDTRSFDRVAQLQHSHNEIEFLDASGAVAKTITSETTLRWIYKSEMELLMRLAGFQNFHIWGSFDRKPLALDNDAMIVEAWKE
jgi:SAM-dependent methyltransferase